MESKRLVEMLGSAVVGAGLIVLGYEFMAAGDEGGSKSSASSDKDEPDGEDAEPADPDAEVPAGGESGGAEEDEPAEADGPAPLAGGPGFDVDAEGHYESFPDIYDHSQTFDAEDEDEYPEHGLVTSGAVTVRASTDADGPRLGLLRAGTRVRVKEGVAFGGGCSKGWKEIWPEGWVCLNAGLSVGTEPPPDGSVDVAKPNVDEPLPLEYWRVNHDGTPFFHRLPSYEEQDRADSAAKAWLASKGREPMPTHPEQRPSDVPAVVKEYMNAGYYVTVASEHIKSQRRFVKTNRGVYARKYQLEQREGSDYEGYVLPNGAEDLPKYFIVRSMPLERRESEGSGIMIKTDIQPERRSLYEFESSVRIGDFDYYVDADGNHLRAYAVGKARKIKKPPGIGAEEHWVHVDLSEQVLVAYIGTRPVFTTLVSTGKEDGMTPIGVHRIQSKHIVTSMRDQPVEDEAYSIEDVPWTQYFSNNVALHGAFWHGGFGLVRSHGCVNLSPADARWLFGFLGPSLPENWHSRFPQGENAMQASAVVITE